MRSGVLLGLVIGVNIRSVYACEITSHNTPADSELKELLPTTFKKKNEMGKKKCLFPHLLFVHAAVYHLVVESGGQMFISRSRAVQIQLSHLRMNKLTVYRRVRYRRGRI